MTHTILDLMDRVLSAVFAAPSWDAWRVVLKAIFGLPMTSAELELFRQLSGRTEAPTEQAREVWLIVGRRAGKSFICALIAVFMTCVRTYRLAPGEKGLFMVIAADRRQARVVRRYIRALLHLSPVLRQMIAPAGDTATSKGETQTAIYLTNGLVIEIHTASTAAVRGYTVVGAIADEIAFWPTDEAAHSDTAVLEALRPAMATVPDALLLLLSSPYARRGEMWKAFQRFWGQDHRRTLVIKADTLTLNPTASREIIDQAYADDPAAAAAEYGAEFRRDVESFIDPDALSAVTVPGRHSLGYSPEFSYVAFTDPAGGSGTDSFTLAIAHRLFDSERVVVDVVLERRPPFSPEATVEEFAKTLHAFGLSTVIGDRYAGEWPREQFRKHGIAYTVADRAKSDIYQAFLPMVNSSRLELLDNPRLLSQLTALERRTARGGRDSIDHPPKGRDDVANVVAGACVFSEDGHYQLGGTGVCVGFGHWIFESAATERLRGRMATFGDPIYEPDPLVRDMKARGKLPITTSDVQH